MTLGTRLRFAIALTTGLLALAAGAGSASAAVHSFLIGGTLQHPIGVAATKDKLLITQECNTSVMAMDTQGRLSTYATLPDNPTCPEVEDYIAAVPQEATGAWRSGDAYVMAGNHIYRIDQRGRVSLLSTGPCSADTQAAIAFDRVGTWGGGLIAECGGFIYRVDSAGRARLVINLGVYSEGAQVIPPGSVLPQYTGWLMVAEEFANGGQVEVVDPTGTQRAVVGSWPDAEHVNFIPKLPCAFGNTNGVFFAAYPQLGPGYLIAYPQADLVSLAGRFVVSGEDNTGLGVITGPGMVAPFDTTNTGTFEGSSFVDWAKTCAL